jgi:UDP-glucose 4-epimerase
VILDGKSIAVIGGAGFIGSQLVSELLKTTIARVIIYDNFARGSKKNLESSLGDSRVEIFADGGDVRDFECLTDALKGVDGVFHLAALWLLQCHKYPNSAFEVNVRGTLNVLQACVLNGVEKLIFSSSASVYGDAVEIPMTEMHPLNNRNVYGATKIAGEALCQAFMGTDDLSFIGLRYMNVYGPRQDDSGAYTGVIPRVLSNIENNISPVIFGDGLQSYDFISVRDVARCNLLALQSNVGGEFFNVGTGVSTTIKLLCEKLLEKTESPLKILYRPPELGDVRGLVNQRVACTAKAEAVLGFRYQDSVDSGLDTLLRWRADNR